MPPRQLELLPWINPLPARLGAEFFRELPTAPGVYRWLSREAEVLYVGSSRNLRQRVGSYRSIGPQRSPRRLCRLVHAAQAIHIEPTETEAEARALEASWIRHYRPRFNRALNRPPESIWIGWWHEGNALTTAWTRGEDPPEGWPPEADVRGPFAHRRGLYALQALRRTLWWTTQERPDLRDCPPALRADREIPVRYVQPLPHGHTELARLAATAEQTAERLTHFPWNAPLLARALEDAALLARTGNLLAD